MNINTSEKLVSTPELMRRSLMNYASSLQDMTMPMSKLTAIYEELELYRKHIKMSHGEGSVLHQITTSMLTLSRLACSDDVENIGTHSWVEKYDITRELIERVIDNYQYLLNHQITLSRTLSSN